MEAGNYYALNGNTEEVTSEMLPDSNRLKSMGYSEKQVRQQRFAHLKFKFLRLMELAGDNDELLDLIEKRLDDIHQKILEMTSKESEVEEPESCVASSNPDYGEDHQATPLSIKGSGKLIKARKKKSPVVKQQRKPRRCWMCWEYANHDSRNCPTKYHIS